MAIINNATGMAQGITQFSFGFNCSTELYFKKKADSISFGANLRSVRVIEGAAWRQGCELIEDDPAVFNFARAVCYSKDRYPYFQIKYMGDVYAETEGFEGSESGIIYDRNAGAGYNHLDVDCFVDTRLMTMSPGAEFVVDMVKGDRGDTWLHAFQLRSGKAGDAAKHPHIVVKYWYDPIIDYTRSSFTLANTNVLANGSDKINIRIIPGKYDKHIFHRITIYNSSNNNSIVIVKKWDEKDTTPIEISHEIPKIWCKNIPNASSGVGYVKVETFFQYLNDKSEPITGEDVSKVNGTTKTKLLGTSGPVSFIYNVPTTYVPVIGGLKYNVIPIQTNEQINSVSKDWVEKGLYVQGACGVQLHPYKMQGSWGSTIKSLVFVESSFKSFKASININEEKTSWYESEKDDTKWPNKNSTFNPATDITDQTVKSSGNIVYSVYAIDSRGRTSAVIYTSVIPIISYSPPSFVSTRTNRVTARQTDDGFVEYDIAEDGTAISVFASITHSQVVYTNKETEIQQDINLPTLTFQYRERNTNAWSEPISLESDEVINYASYTFDPQKEYQIRFELYDKLTESLSQPNILIVDLASNECTMYWKRDGLGIGIGQKTQTSRHLRALEISPDWIIMHGQEGDNIYYVPDIVFTKKGDHNTPKRKIGRIWLKEVD